MQGTAHRPTGDLQLIRCAAGAFASVCLAGCANAPSPVTPPSVRVQPSNDEVAPAPDAVLPVSSSAGALVLAEVDGRPVTASDVLPRLYLAEPDAARDAVRQAVIDRLVELEAGRTGWTVGRQTVEAEVARFLEEFEGKVQASTLGAGTVASYLKETFGLTPEEYTVWVRRSMTTSLLLERLVLLELWSHPRVQIRVMRVRTPDLARELHDKVRRGADFAALARRHSEDGAAADGGLYPALPSDIGYPLLDEVAGLEPGSLDEVREVVLNDRTEWRVLQVVARLPAKKSISLEEVCGELDARVVTELELDAWMRICAERHRVRFHGLSAPTMEEGRPGA